MTALLIILSSFAMAGEINIKEEKVPVKEGYQTMDMNQFKSLDSKPKGKSGFQVSTGCKSKSGVQYNSGDSGFDACLREADNDRAVDRKNGASPSLNFSTGQ